ncbi:hypothetical protein ABTF35_13855 [Acinetobacter baumannii]|nr:hypothetical protein [Acinetobacter baumannii]
MKDKTLEQKVSLALYGAVIFFAFLFTLGLILKADLFGHWPTASEVYEVGRDALTLTAYFLAPAAALVLFSDWRIQHNITKSDNFFDEIEHDLHQAYTEVEDIVLMLERRGKVTEEYQDLLSNKIVNLSERTQEMYVKLNNFKYKGTEEGLAYLIKCKELTKLVSGYVLQLIVISVDIVANKDATPEEEKGRLFLLSKNIQAFRTSYERLETELRELNRLKPLI